MCETKMAYHSNGISLDISFSLTGLPPLHSAYSNFDTIKIVLSRFETKKLYFKNSAYL